MAKIKKLASGAQDLLATNAIEVLSGGNGDDILRGYITGSGNSEAGSVGNTITGGNGNDTIIGSNRDDVIWADSAGSTNTTDNGSDTINAGFGHDEIHGGNGKDKLFGEGDNDAIYGENGADFLDGGAGSDKLYGGHGGDVQTGGNGADTFVITTNTIASVADSAFAQGELASLTPLGASPWDIITDFQSGSDKIDLDQLDSKLTGDGGQLHWYNVASTDDEAAVSDTARQHGVWTSKDGNFLYADINGDGAADMKIQVSNVGRGDFIGVDSNDGPIDGNESNIATEDTWTVATGNLLTNATDVNGDDTDIASVTDGVPTSESDFNVEVVGDYGTLYVNNETGAYKYVLDHDKANGLAHHQSAADSFAYVVTDNSGGSDASTLTIEITGTNDAPVITEEAGAAAGAVYEDADGDDVGSEADAAQVVSGVLTFTDADASDGHSVGYVIDQDVIDLSALLDAGFGSSSNVGDFARLVVSGSNVRVEVDTNGPGGSGFDTAATLQGYANSNPLGSETVKVFFEGTYFNLTT